MSDYSNQYPGPQPPGGNRAITYGIIALSVMLVALAALIGWLVFGRGPDSNTAEPATSPASHSSQAPQTPAPDTAPPASEPPASEPAPSTQAPAETTPPQEPLPQDETQPPAGQQEPDDPATADPAPATPAPATPAPAKPEPAKPQPAKPTSVPQPAKPEPAKPKPKPPVQFVYSGKATFKNFTVEVPDVVSPTDDKFGGVMVKVCVTKSLDDAGPGLTKVTDTPWTIEDSNGKVYKPKATGHFPPAFPKQAALKVGECASGHLVFDLIKDSSVTSTIVRYQNGLGDVAEWVSS